MSPFLPWYLASLGYAGTPVPGSQLCMQGYVSATLVTDALLVPGGGDVKIESQKLNFKEKAQAKVGSLDNVGHLPAGGAVKVVRDSSAEGEGRGVESGPQKVGAVTTPQSLQESCVPHSIVHHRPPSVRGEAGEMEIPAGDRTFS